MESSAMVDGYSMQGCRDFPPHQWKDVPMLAFLTNMFVSKDFLQHQLLRVSLFLISKQRCQGTMITKRAWGVLTSASGSLVTLSRGTQLGLAWQSGQHCQGRRTIFDGKSIKNMNSAEESGESSRSERHLKTSQEIPSWLLCCRICRQSCKGLGKDLHFSWTIKQVSLYNFLPFHPAAMNPAHLQWSFGLHTFW